MRMASWYMCYKVDDKWQQNLCGRNLSFFFAVPRLLVVSNPTEQARTSMVTVYVNSPNVRLLDAVGHVVRAQVSAVWNDATHAAVDVFQVRSATVCCMEKINVKIVDSSN